MDSYFQHSGEAFNEIKEKTCEESYNVKFTLYWGDKVEDGNNFVQLGVVTDEGQQCFSKGDSQMLMEKMIFIPDRSYGHFNAAKNN